MASMLADIFDCLSAKSMLILLAETLIERHREIVRLAEMCSKPDTKLLLPVNNLLLSVGSKDLFGVAFLFLLPRLACWTVVRVR